MIITKAVCSHCGYTIEGENCVADMERHEAIPIQTTDYKVGDILIKFGTGEKRHYKRPKARHDLEMHVVKIETIGVSKSHKLTINGEQIKNIDEYEKLELISEREIDFTSFKESLNGNILYHIETIINAKVVELNGCATKWD